MYRTNLRNRLGLALLFAVILLPLGAASAKDKQAKPDKHLNQVWAKLEAAVEAGKISAEDAKAKMVVIKKKQAAKAGPACEKPKVDAYLKQIWAKLQAAVKAGKMSAEDAEAKMASIKKAKLDGGRKTTEFEAVGRKLKAAVEAGKLTEKEAKKKWAAIKKAAGAKAKK